MSVTLSSIKGGLPASTVEEISNGTWKAITALGNAYEPNKIPVWNGNHDGQEWTAEQCKTMADRLVQAATIIPVLRSLEKSGGVKIS